MVSAKLSKNLTILPSRYFKTRNNWRWRFWSIWWLLFWLSSNAFWQSKQISAQLSNFKVQRLILTGKSKLLKITNFRFIFGKKRFVYFQGQAVSCVQTSSGFRYSLTNRSITFSKLALIKPSQTSCSWPKTPQTPSKVSSIYIKRKEEFSSALHALIIQKFLLVTAYYCLE